LPAEVFKLVSHPLAGLPSQSPKPGLHVNPHVPAAQVTVAFARAGHDVGAVPSSIMPSQSSSALLHTSALGATFCRQRIAPPKQIAWPEAHGVPAG
jgi:hypothetical protein